MEQGIRHYQQPKTESEVEDFSQAAFAFTDYAIEEIALLKQENRDLKVSLRISQWKLDRAYDESNGICCNNRCQNGDHDVIASTDLV
jgi:hypothetical protein